jgi:hypothetical protein
MNTGPVEVESESKWESHAVIKLERRYQKQMRAWRAFGGLALSLWENDL